MNHLIVLCMALLHPYYVSVGELFYNEEEEAVQISYLVFLDDLELALRRESGDEKLNILRDSTRVKKVSEAYFKKNFQLRINGARVEYTYLGGEVEDDGMWCYMEVRGIKKKPGIHLTNTLLTEIYEDQQNIIHFKISGDKKSFIMNKTKTEVEYKP